MSSKLKNSEIELTSQFDEAFDILENTEQNLFITGKAGTGKTTFLDYFRNNTEKNVVVVAPTGISAINVKGQTIHSFFRFKPRFLDVQTIGRARKDLRKLYNKIDILIIDEISMVRADMFDAIERFLMINGKDSGLPFGGVQICIIGDLFQLPPVLTHNEKDLFYSEYNSPYFFSANSFNKKDFTFIEFDKIFRQSERNFINLLNKIRDGSLDHQSLTEINARVDNSQVSDDTIILCATNKVADNVNEYRLKQIDKPAFEFDSVATGDFKVSTQLPAPSLLTLKVGTQVMFLRNDKDKRWVNGSIGTITKLDKKTVHVLANGEEYEIVPDQWDMIKYEYDEEKDKVSEVVKGTFKQLPLQLAWAITIHKSQSKTFDKVVVDLGYGAFASGQTYVALSRCRTFEGLTLRKPIKAGDVIIDKTVVDFLNNY